MLRFAAIKRMNAASVLFFICRALLANVCGLTHIHKPLSGKGGCRMIPSINIFCIKINNIANNGAFSIGETLHYGHAAHTKSTGSNVSYGDQAPPTAQMRNVYVDPDVNDQGSMTMLDPPASGAAGTTSKGG